MRLQSPHRGFAHLALAVISLLAFESASAQTAVALTLPDGYRLTPSPAVLALASVADGADDAGYVDSAESLLDAAVMFSGALPERAEAARLAGLTMIREARSMAETASGPMELGGLLLGLVHSKIRVYNELESRLDYALLDGRYNCVGSSTLYTIAARAAGLNVHGVILPDHAYCFLIIDGARVDVETTSPGGYGDATKRGMVSDSGAGTFSGAGARSRTGSGVGIEANARGIVALALRNRATLYERAGNWAAALALAADAYAYASGNLRSDAPGDRATWETLAGRVNNVVATLSKADRYADALLVADGAIATYGPDAGFVELRKAARTGLLMDSVRKAAPSSVLALVDEAQAEGGFDPEALEITYAYAYAMLAEEKRKAGDHLGAWAVAIEGVSRFPGSKDIATIARTARSNWVKDAHNRFAALFNAGKYAEAEALMGAALSVAPEERLFIDDAAAAREAVAEQSGAVSP